MAQDSPPSSPWLIVGLGNPGTRYVNTRHNIGFVAVEELAVRNRLSFSTKQANAQLARGTIDGHPVILAKPMTYMNNSGQAVNGLANFYKIPHNRLIVLYDDIALPVGTIRIREQGSAGGHNGIRSLIQHLGTQAFPRLRIGVDRPIDPRHSQIDWVLGHFNKDDQKKLEDVIPRAAEAVESVLRIGIERSMNSYNVDPNEAPKTKREKAVEASAEEKERA